MRAHRGKDEENRGKHPQRGPKSIRKKNTKNDRSDLRVELEKRRKPNKSATLKQEKWMDEGLTPKFENNGTGKKSW